METKLLRAEEVPLGAVVVHPYVDECFGRVTRLCVNPHFGWIGFELNDSPCFNGWHKRGDLVRVAA